MVLGIRPPEVDLKLENYPGLDRAISVSPNNTNTPSLGLFYVGTLLRDELREEGYDVELSLVDMPIQEPQTLSQYKGKFTETQTVAYGRGKVIKSLRGMPLSRLEHIADGADIVFMTSPFTSNAASVAQVALKIKEIKPNAKILVGGRDAQHRPEWYLSNGADVVFLGQAENLVGKVCDALLQNRNLDGFYGIASQGNSQRSLGPKSYFKADELRRAGVSSLVKANSLVSRDADLRKEVLPDFSLLDLSNYNQSSDGYFPDGVKGPAMWYQSSVGCPRECGFCATANNPYMGLGIERVERLLKNYSESGIKTLMSAEDNFLARLFKRPEQSEYEIIEIMKLIRQYGFAHEFTDGLEVGLLMDRNGRIRTRLIEEIFKTETIDGRLAGTHRLYWPIETFVSRANYKKLRAKEQHYEILKAVLDQGIPQIGFGTILFHDVNPDYLKKTEDEIGEFCNWMSQNQGQTRWRLAVFHELPLPGSHYYKGLRQHLAFPIETHPELWALPINPLNGINFNYAELYDIKRNLMGKYDPAALNAWDNRGKYELTIKQRNLS